MCNVQELLEMCDIQGKPTSVKNLQANLLVECLIAHLVTNFSTWLLKEVMATKTWISLQFVFGWDIIFCQQLLIDWVVSNNIISKKL